MVTNQRMPSAAPKISDEQLSAMAANCRQFIDLYLADNRTSIRPQVYSLSYDRSGETGFLISIVASGFNTDEVKQAALREIGRYLYQQQRFPLAWFLMSEAWVSQQDPRQPRKYRLPEDDPDRREVVLYHGMSLDGRTRHAFVPIARDADGRISAAGEWEVHDAAVPVLLREVLRGFILSSSSPALRAFLAYV